MTWWQLIMTQIDVWTYQNMWFDQIMHNSSSNLFSFVSITIPFTYLIRKQLMWFFLMTHIKLFIIIISTFCTHSLLSTLGGFPVHSIHVNGWSYSISSSIIQYMSLKRSKIHHCDNLSNYSPTPIHPSSSFIVFLKWLFLIFRQTLKQLLWSLTLA